MLTSDAVNRKFRQDIDRKIDPPEVGAARNVRRNRTYVFGVGSVHWVTPAGTTRREQYVYVVESSGTGGDMILIGTQQLPPLVELDYRYGVLAALGQQQ